MLKLIQKNGYYFPIFYKVGTDKGSIFFQSLCEVAILHFAFLYSWAEKMATSFLAVEIYTKDEVWGKSVNLPEISLFRPQHHHRFY